MKKFIFLLSFIFLINGIGLFAEGESYDHTVDDYEYQKRTNHSDQGEQENGGGDDSKPGKEKKDPDDPDDDDGDPDDTPSEPPEETELTEISAEEILIENDVENTDSIDDLELSAKASQNEAAEKAEVTKAEKEGQKVNQENIEEITDETASSKEDTSGDPVKISKGTYEQEESDFDTIEIKRRYESDIKVTGSLGYGWITNLDERIIAGVDANLEKEIKALQTYIDKLKVLAEKLEEDLAESYHVESIYEAKGALEERIKSCKENINKLNELTKKIDNYKKKYYYKEDYVKRAEEKRSKAAAVKKTAQTKRDMLQSAYNQVDSDIAKIRQLKELRSAAQTKLAEKKKLKEKKDQIIKRNKTVLFRGMGTVYQETGFNTVTVIDADGYPYVLEIDKETVKKSFDNKYTSCKEKDGSYTLTDRNGITREYDKAGFLVLIKDRNGNTITIKRNEEEKVEYIENSYGEKYSVEYTDNKISKITNVRMSEECVVYEYNLDNLVSVKDTDGDTVVMEYDDGRMTSLNKCDGSKVFFEYGEQTVDGRVLATATTNEEGFTERFDYYPDNSRTDYIDHDGNRTSYYYDTNRRTTKEIRSDGSVIENEYDSSGNLKRVKENGSSVTYSYDKWGNKTHAVYEDGSFEDWTYDVFNLVTSYTDRDGVREEFLRDPKGNLYEYRCGGRRVYTQDFNSKGQIIKCTVYGDKTVITEYEYDSFGNVTSEICGGVKTEYEYDEKKRVTKIKTAGKLVAEYNYDGHKTVQKNFNGLETTYLTNGRKDLVKITQKDTVTGEVHQTRIEYDKRHLPLRVYAGDGESEQLIISYQYTAEGKLKAEILHGKQSWVKLYNYRNGQISELKQFKTSADLTVIESLQSTGIETTAENGNIYTQKISYRLETGNRKLLTITDGLGIRNLFEYDSYGNLTKTTDGNGEVRQSTYTRGGRLATEQSSHGGWYEYSYGTDGFINRAGEKDKTSVKAEYYPDGNIKSQTDRYGKVTTYNYDERGRVESLQSEVKKVWYGYDDFDRIKSQTVGSSSDKTSAIYYLEYNYSDDGRTVIVTEGGKYKTVNALDAFGNVIKQTDGVGNEKSFTYNVQNQLTESFDGYNNKTSYEYNALGEISRVTLPDGSAIDYEYNYTGQLSKITDACGVVYEASYDKAGRLVKEQSRADSEKSYEYDNAGRVIKVFSGGELVESYTYGPDGRSLTVKDGNGENYLYNYDGFGRLVSERNRNNLEQNYFYDEEGQFKSQNNFDGTSTTITYSSDRTVRTVTYSDGSENRFVYDALGNITEAENAYVKTEYRYDQGGRLVYQKDVTTGEEVYFEYDIAGNRTRLLSTNRETKYTYGKNNEVKEIFDNKQRLSIKLEYDKNGREVLRKFGNGTQEESLYDRAGRVTVKMQKTERGELLWGEGYLYGSDGKRTATVDNLGCVTLYEYNKKGQLETVYYPYTQELVNNLKKEAGENGLPASADLGENCYLTSSEKASLTQLMNSMQYGLSYNLTNLQVFIKESYVYDKNGNRISKTTPYGKIEYTYDKENCLLSSGSRGQSFVTYTYDKMGNLLTEESQNKTTKYAYNSQNRMIYCEVLDKTKKEYAQTSYAYDAFGRRIIVQDKGEAALRTLYDGLTFDVIKQSPTFQNGLFTDSNQTGIRWGATGRPTGDRYRYLDDENTKDNNRYFYLDENTYKTSNSRYRGERTELYINGTIAAQSTSDYGSEYFSTDLLGSIRTTTDSYGSKKSAVSYDAFGSLIEGSLSSTTDHGYLGKQHDPIASLYNYGYRDYKSQFARFTTVDPIRDGANWFAYCISDPVNFIDTDGLAYRDRYGVWRSNSDKMYELDAVMNNHNKDEYVTAANKKQGEKIYRCDDYVQTVLKESRLYKDKDFAGDSSQKTVAEHIKNAKENEIKKNKKNNAPELNKGSAYVVFMGDSYKGYEEHCGIIRVGADGTIYYSDNSKGNVTEENTRGGVITAEYDNLQKFQNDYGYNSFYYEEIDTKKNK